jgi:hypothetical protein
VFRKIIFRELSQGHDTLVQDNGGGAHSSAAGAW